MLKAFNSFQLVVAFAAFPFAISWLADATFRGAGVAFYVACAAYVVSFAVMVGCVYESID
jgi:hypothetical protein